jgi:hypothetical protein
MIEGRNMKERICGILGVSSLLVVFAMLLTSCATTEIPKQANTEESLRNTASQYWNLRMAGKYKDALKFEDKNVLMENNKLGQPLNEYYEKKAAVAGTVTSISVDSVRISHDKGMVNMIVNFTLPELPKPVHQFVSDDWVFKDGRWLHLLK